MEKIHKIALLLFLCVWGAVSCSEEHPFSSAFMEKPVSTLDLGEIGAEGMVYVKASGEKTFLGTRDVLAKSLERPQMNVDFTYDFYIGRHEVICKDFNETMGFVTGVTVPCLMDSLPASNVTFFDAVLYANALSKKYGLDSAYSFSKVELDAEKHCVKMKNFKFVPKASGYRLPTEAEWTLVASENWNPGNGWNAVNSGAVVHKVCSSNESQNRICDMAGNMLELVNDRYASFKDTTVANFVGSIDGDALGSCVVKGGSYYSSPTTMNLYNRGDTYPILSSTKGDYIGFRLARGSIPDAMWFSDNGSTVSAPITPLIESAELKSMTGSYNAKLVFRNDAQGNLVYMNFGKTTTVVQFEDGVEVFHPDISPNGKYVAFCTSMEGSSQTSFIYVRDLTDASSKAVRMSSMKGAIPRWRVNPNGDTVIVFVSSAGGNRGDQFLLEGTWQVKFSNGEFGTPEKIFDGAYHGGVLNDNRLAISSSPLLRARLSDGTWKTDMIWYNGEQACNASLAKDGSNRTLFLDFGGSEGREFVGIDYGVHERLLIADSTGRLVQSVPSPAGYSFDHSEWAVGILKDSASNLVVATLSDINGVHREVVLVDLNDGRIVPLVEGEELWHPCLWVWQDSPNRPKPVVDMDSAGVYYDSEIQNPYSFAAVEMGIKLKSFWKECDDLQAVTLGSSMLLDAVDDKAMIYTKTLNMGVSMMDINLFDYLIRNYVIPYAPNVKYLVVELSPGLMFRSYQEVTAFVLESSPGILYDRHHLSEATKNEVAEFSQQQQFPKILLGQQYLDGTFLMPSGSWEAPIVNVDLTPLTFDALVLQYNLKIWELLKALADSKGIQLIAAIPPRNPGYKDTEAFDPYGPSWEVAHQIIDAVKNMGIMVFDEYKDGHHDYTDAMAYNPNHLSYLGAAQFTARLDAFLSALP